MSESFYRPQDFVNPKQSWALAITPAVAAARANQKRDQDLSKLRHRVETLEKDLIDAHQHKYSLQHKIDRYEQALGAIAGWFGWSPPVGYPRFGWRRQMAAKALEDR